MLFTIFTNFKLQQEISSSKISILYGFEFFRMKVKMRTRPRRIWILEAVGPFFVFYSFDTQYPSWVLLCQQDEAQRDLEQKLVLVRQKVAAGCLRSQ